MKLISPIVLILLLYAVTSMVRAQEIFQAVKDSNLVKVKELIEKDPSLLSMKDQSGRTPFHWAAANGNIEMAAYLLSKGSNINNKNISQSTPLHAAASANNLNMAEWLTEHGADVNAKNNSGLTPLFWAAGVGRKELVELLLNKGAELNAKDANGYMPLDLALGQGNKDALEVLMGRGAKFDMTGEKAIEVLQTSAEKGIVRVFNAAVEKSGGNLFSDESQNKITMNKAISGGSVEIVEELQAKGIPLEFKGDKYGWTPVHFAADGGKVAMLDYLVQKGADINGRTLAGESAYNIAAAKNNTEVMDAIKKLGGNSDPQKFPVLEGPYLGQKPPGKTPELFAPGIISTDAHEFSCCYSPDGKEFYFARWYPMLNHRVVMVSKMVNGVWTEPDVAPFVDKQDTFEPFVTPDNRRLYFQCGKVVGGALQMFTMYVDRTENGWSEMKDPGDPFNTGKTMHISAAANGTLYTTDISGGMTNRTNLGSSGPGNECMGIMKQVNGKYEKLEKLGPPLNKEKFSQHPWIAPDESYMVFCVRRPDQPISAVLFYATRNNDGTWNEPGEIHLGINAGQPFITPDGKYLFFTRMEQEQGDLYWVSTDILEELRPKK